MLTRGGGRAIVFTPEQGAGHAVGSVAIQADRQFADNQVSMNESESRHQRHDRRKVATVRQRRYTVLFATTNHHCVAGFQAA